MALVLAQTVAGGIALAFCTPLWNEVKRGFFKLTGSILAGLSLATWATLRAASSAPAAPGNGQGLAVGTALAITVLTLAWLALLFARRPKAARAIGVVTAALALVLLGSCAGAAEAAFPLATFQMLAGAAFLGAVLDGLLLGHWYLTDRGLSRTPIDRYANILLVAVGLQFVAVLSMGFGPNEGSESFNPLLTSAGLSSWIALGMVVATGLIAVLIKATLRGTRSSAVQSATGFFYLAVLTAFTAALAAMVGFLPAV
jgi:hypothetical protein